MDHILKITMLTLLLSVSSASAKLSQKIDRTDISAGETFVLDIQTDSATDDSPDLSMIPADITIVSNSQYQHTQIINGRRSGIKGWKLKLKTLKPGKLVIPAIPVGNESTLPITLNIKESSFKVDVNGQKDAVFLKAEVDQNNPYVQQQIIYTVSLYRSVSTHYENLSIPTVENSIIEKLGDDVVFDKMIDNKRYTVYQRKYIIFPQQSGDIKIGPVNFTADVNDSNRKSRSLFLNSTRPISISTQPINLKVKAKPANTAAPWLPAEHVSLVDRWSTDPGKQQNAPLQLKVGEPATWTLYLSVQGQSESQLPELTIPKVDGLQIYPDAPQKERQINENGILGKRVEKFAIIPSKQGPLTIPAIELKWWDTKTNTLKTASIAARTFNVVAGEMSNQAPVNLATIPAPVTQTTLVDHEALKQWQMISAALLILWFFTLLAYFKKTTKVPVKPAKTEKARPEQSHQEALKKARQIINKGSAEEIASAILESVNSLGNTQYYSLGSLAQQISDKPLAEKLNGLDEQRYSASQHLSSINITNDDLLKIIDAISTPRKNASYKGIPPLYPR